MALSSLSTLPSDLPAYAFSFFTDPSTSLDALFVPRDESKTDGARVITLDERVWGPLGAGPGADSDARASYKGKERARDDEEPLDRTLDRTSSSSETRRGESRLRSNDRLVGPSSRGAIPMHEDDRRAEADAGRGRTRSRSRERARRRIGWSDDEDDEAEHRRTRSPKRDSRARDYRATRRSLSPIWRERERSRSPTRRRRSPSPPSCPPSSASKPKSRPRGGRREREKRLRRERRSSPPPFRRSSPPPRREESPPPRWTRACSPPRPPHSADRPPRPRGDLDRHSSPPPLGRASNRSHRRSPTPPPFTSDRLAVPLSNLEHGIPFEAYSPYLLASTPVDPHWSMSFHFTLLRFLAYCAPISQWSTRPSSPVFQAPCFLPETMQLLDTQPDAASIRRLFPLRRAQPPNFAPRETARWASVQDVVVWLYGPNSVSRGFPETAWLVQEAPLPLVVLVRRFADVSRYRTAVAHAWRECARYLLDPCRPPDSLSQHEQRAASLMRWLNRGGTQRQVACFALVPGEEGSREEEVWEWWFRGEEGKERGERELDEWERERVERRRRGGGEQERERR